MRAVTAEQMRRIDRRARERFGIPELILMEQAGTAVARRVRRVWSRGRHPKPGPILILAGGGANGGDGLVAARHLDNAGLPVQLLLLADSARVKGAARVNLRIVRNMGIPVVEIRSSADGLRWTRRRIRPGVIVDALLGTGVRDAVREPLRCVIRWINRQRCPVIAVDLPSGLSSDTGRPFGVAVRASRTVTLGLPKVGLRRPGARAWSGRIEVAEISLPKVLLKENGHD